ncbi:MAG: TetR family transcriptional regulator [Sulfuricurvum sp.]|uniref:TetR/AcrR family transcriptional regulator n=1 Tax=Sulfuricurvum sp. TaxID=2025608 RepID=UPI0026220B32|nr:TetR family transcriptional regulator [Sulfuricurvum sp.]MDD5118492.1 TetR family transcriptional regulator [Sulfuricurvum sp.]
MKISQDAKELTKIKILEAGVELIIEKGFKNASMREMAKNAGVSNPTIYNYFPTKEQMLYTYIELKHQQTQEILNAIEDFHTYTLREQLQTLIETELELYLEDREFVIQIADMVFHSSSLKLESLYATNRLFTDMVGEMIAIAIDAGEIEKPPFEEYLPKLFWDYFVVVVAYWVKDESESFENTTQFIDHSMGVIEALLQSNLLNKASELGMFLFKNHLLSSLTRFSTKQSRFTKMKRKLGEVFHG